MPIKTKPLPTQEYLHECFNYNSETGELFWKARPRHHYSSDLVWKRENKRLAKKSAGNFTSLGYREIGVNRARYLAHRIIWKMAYNKEPDLVDHKDRIKSNNILSNLREASSVENNRNKTYKPNETSGQIGVTLDKRRNKWKAEIGLEGKTKFLGHFDDLGEAIRVRKEAEENTSQSLGVLTWTEKVERCRKTDRWMM